MQLIFLFMYIILFVFLLNKLSSVLNNIDIVSEDKIESILNKNIFSIFIISCITTIIIQSSSLLIIIVLMLFSKNKLNIKTSFTMIIAANIGTTFSLLMFSYSSIHLYFILFILSFIFSIINKHIFKILILIICLLFTLSQITNILSMFYLDYLYNYTDKSYLILFSLLLTIVIQSSSSVLLITQNLYTNKILNINDLIYILIGANIGSVSTSLFTSIFIKNKTILLVLFHLFYNLIGMILLLIYINLLINITSNQNIYFHTFLIHFIFNISSAICIFILYFIYLVTKRICK